MVFKVWRKSSRSQGANSDCVEAAATTEYVGLRDSKDPQGGNLIVDAIDWPALLHSFADKAS